MPVLRSNVVIFLIVAVLFALVISKGAGLVVLAGGITWIVFGYLSNLTQYVYVKKTGLLLPSFTSSKLRVVAYRAYADYLPLIAKYKLRVIPDGADFGWKDFSYQKRPSFGVLMRVLFKDIPVFILVSLIVSILPGLIVSPFLVAIFISVGKLIS
jgi:hypothetical protein